MSDLSVSKNTAPAAVLQRAYEALLVIGDGPFRSTERRDIERAELRSIGLFANIEEAREAVDQAAKSAPCVIATVTRIQHGSDLDPSSPRLPDTAEKEYRRFAVYQAPSDYMAPSIKSGDYVEIDTSVTALSPYKHLPNFSDGMFLLDFPGGEPMIRRLQSCFNGRYHVYCDRDARFRTEAEEIDEADLKILGRVTRVMNVSRVG